MDEYDIGAAFAEIEDELISSMIRNLARHKLDERVEDMQWSMWQAEQLRALEEYRRSNRKKFAGRFQDINTRIEEALHKARAAGGTDQEQEILEAIKKGFSGTKVPAGLSGQFFRMNDQKLDALIKATVNDMQRAEVAILRMADDQYRRIIYNAQVYANTGAGTYAKAVDMATKDMLAAGLNCVTYKNGARHRLEDYAEMALRTASKRAYLQGEGEKRQEWGVTTVVLNKRLNPCPQCLPWVGKVLVDDVWSGGRSDGKSGVTGITYPTMSAAIDGGLYHPRCKDSHTTYFEGLSDPTEGNRYTREELDQLAEQYRQEQKAQYAARQTEKYGRLEEYSLDPENKQAYGARKQEFGDLRERLEQKNRGKKVEITEQAINKVNRIEPYGFTEENCDYITATNKELLRIAKNENNSNEVACLVDLTKNDRYNFIKGDRHSVDFLGDSDTFHAISTSDPLSLMVCHNHPGCTFFSGKDLNIFMQFKSLKSMSVVTNQGVVVAITKTNKFDIEKARKTMQSLLEENGTNIEKVIDLFFKQCYDCGIEIARR